MVDFSKKLRNKKKKVVTDPTEIYKSLDRQSEKVGPLRSSQEKVLHEWYDNRINNKDVILKLNTGAGKTLVGLLMLESKRRIQETGTPDKYGIEIFLCNDSNLIEQTIHQASLFGLSLVTLTENNMIPTEVINCEKILITSVQKFFNGKSIFERNDSPIIDTIVIDDAHTSAELVKNSCTLTIQKATQDQLYTDILNVVSEGVKNQGQGTFQAIIDYNANSTSEVPFLPVPYWTWIDKSEIITRLISARAEQANDIKFVWPLLRDSLELCTAIVSSVAIEITPIKYPVIFYTHFINANQRIFMSATTASDSVLLNDLGIEPAAVKSPLLDSDEKWSGEKMVIIPSMISDNLSRGAVVKLFGKMKSSKFGITAIVPSYYKTHDWEKYGATIGKTNVLDQALERFNNNHFGSPLVLVNRYDGIDLPDDETRILVLDSMPNFRSLFEKYLESVVPDGSETILRKAQRIEQGMGRSVRADTDYSVILFIVPDLVKFIRDPNFKAYFSNQTLQQIQIGIDISKDARSELKDAHDNDADLLNKSECELLDLIAQSLHRDEDWKEYYREQMAKVDYTVKANSDLQMIIEKSKLISMATDKVVSISTFKTKMENFIDKYCKSDKEKGWYFQLLAHITYRISKSNSNAIQMTAYKKNHSLLLPENSNIDQKITAPVAQQRISNIVKQIRSYSRFETFSNAINDLIGSLSFGTNRKSFEKSIDELGKLLGFEAFRPDEEQKMGPDNLWGVKDNEYFVIEDKSEVKESRKNIYKSESGQMNNSIAWFTEHYPSDKYTAILIIPTTHLDPAAGFNGPVRIMRNRSLSRLKKNLRNFANEFRNLDFDSISDNKVLQFVKLHHLNVNDFVENYTELPR